MTTAPARMAPDARRRHLVAVAQRLYGERTYDEVSAAELAQAAGVARGLINHYFGSKRGLYLEALRASVRMPEKVAPDLAGRALADRARRIVSWILDAATTYGQAWVTASGAAELHGESDVQAIVDEADDRAARLVLQGLGLEADERHRARMRTVAPLVKSVYREWEQRGNLTRAEAEDLVVGAVLLAAGLEERS